MTHLPSFRHLVTLLALTACAGAAENELITVSTGAQPSLAYAVERQGDKLNVTVEVAAFAADGSGVEPTLGVAARKQQILAAKVAKATRGDRRARFTWSVPATALIEKPSDWKDLRLAIDVRWSGGAGGGDRRHERYRHIDGREPSAGLSTKAADWAPLDLDDLAQRLADRRDRMLIQVKQPIDGKYSVIVEDAAGRRVRNLAGGLPAAKGEVAVEWDGCDEDGRMVAEGSYRWRSIHHPGLTPEYAMSFANADESSFQPLLSNHCHFTAAAANDTLAVLAAVGTEGGYAMAAFDREGRWKQGYNGILGAGWNAIAVALDDKYLYAAQDGEGWGSSIDRSKPGWQGEVALTLTRFDLAGGGVVDYPSGKRWRELERHPWGPGAGPAQLREQMSLSGMARIGARLYVGSRAAEALLVVDVASGEIVDRIPLAKPGAIAASGDRLVALSAGTPMLIDVAAKSAKPFLSAAAAKAAGIDALEIRSIALAGDGRLFLADARSHTVRVVDAAGKTTTLGTSGGPYAGAWQPERMVAPSGLALLDGRLWVAEDRTAPKRAVAWDLAKRTVVRQVFGNPAYGGPGAGFDPKDATSWVGEGASWKLDLTAKTAQCRGVLGWKEPSPMHWRWIRQEGRTYLLGMGMLNLLALQNSDGTLKPVAAWAACHHFSYAHDWKPPAAFIEGYNAVYKDKPFTSGAHGKPDHGPGALWVDRDGDGAMQQSELEFSGAARFGGGSWGHDLADLTIRLAATIDGKPAVIALTPEGVDAEGVPRYPTLASALTAAVPLKDPPKFDYRSVHPPSSVTRAGDLVVLSDPMTCWAPDGQLRWRYANAWADVHGSHDAPLPVPGVIQGSLFVLGMAAVDATTDAFVINGNHGRFFALTSDGMYLDELFNDCRVAQTRDAMLVGGECFGGVFGRADDGTFYLQTGGDGFRVYRVRGLDRITRDQGNLTVTAKQLQAAQRRAERQQAEVAVAKTARLPQLAKAPQLDASGNGWPQEQIVWSEQGGRYRVAVKTARDDAHLYLRYEVADDPSPWINNGKDWTLLFKSGDSVDLQLGGDPAADPRRTGPVPGDLRLLIAPMGAENVAVLYRHRVPGAKGMVFSSPWRSETVGEVKRLDAARIAVRKGGDSYVVEVAVPFADLGFAPRNGSTCRADFGVIYGDADGTVNLLRNYWSNQVTGLVSDVPGEIMLQPALWGDLTLEAP